MVNPDGVTLEQFGDTAFPSSIRSSLVAMNNGSSNFSDWKANAQGIDPNIQYNGGWYQVNDQITKPWFHGYKGSKPYEINEVKAVLKLIKQTNPQELITYHASGGYVFWGYEVTPQSNPLFYHNALSFGSITSYTVSMPSAAETGGGLTDWWTHNIKRPGFTIEVGPSEGDNPVPMQYFNQIWNQNKLDGLLLAEQSWKLYNQHPKLSISNEVPS
jgi:g-D-glutamyl-meso-diaminopimelate peptidase